MAKFGAQTVERPEYDFTEIPRPDEEGFCTGAGFVPGHTVGEREEYLSEVQDIQRESLKHLPKDFDPESLTIDRARELMDQVDASEGSRLNERLFEATVKACKGSPSREELEELPYDYRQGFCIWLMQELSQPKFSSGSTPPARATNGASTTPSGGTSPSRPRR